MRKPESQNKPVKKKPGFGDGIVYSRLTISGYGKEQIRMSDTKASISYSWDDDQHKEWVAALATKLREDGVATILDQWHAVPGDQLPEFMEKQIRENDYVLIICTPNYRLKSDGRKGGVGYEGDIMTAEVHTRRNHRKFIPILARGTWEDAAPSWLKGKYYIDLSSADRYARNYQDLIATLLGERPIAPPVRRLPQIGSNLQTKGSSPSDPLKIDGVIVDEVTEPTMDGTPGSTLYTVPFRLSRRPSSLWSTIFVRTWNAPPRFTTMHRPRIARVVGSKIILDGTTIDEVKKYHKETLLLCVSKANEEEALVLERRRQEEDRQRLMTEKHTATVEDIAGEINFD